VSEVTAAPGFSPGGVQTPPNADFVVNTLTLLVNHTVQMQGAVIALAGEISRLNDRMETLEKNQEKEEADRRHDLLVAADYEAVHSSAVFIQERMPKARTFDDSKATLRYAAEMVQIPGMALEFGVASGSTLRCIVDSMPGREVWGFDVFSGLPEDWRTGFETGMFAQEIPDVPGARIVQGLFADTLPGFMESHPGPVAFLHLDADLYSSTVTVLDHVGPRLQEGSMVVFDEYFNYPSWQEHEHKAWEEFVDRTGLEFTYEAYTSIHEQLAVRVTAPVRR
jgi:hypothetical protein